MSRSLLKCLVIFQMICWALLVAPRVFAADTVQCHAVQVDAADPQSYLPDPRCTPGVIDPTVRQDNLGTTICQKGYSKRVRPSSSYTTALKKKQIFQYGYKNVDPKNYEEDHLISLELGGSPTDPRNLWPEPHPSINEKDQVENALHAQICSGQKTLAQAQYAIAHNWYDVYLEQNPPSFIEMIEHALSSFWANVKSIFL